MRRTSRSPAGVLVLLAVFAVVWVVSGDDDREISLDVVRVDRVVDGDTARVWVDGKNESVRYIGIDTPESVRPGEPVECYGDEAKRFNERLLGRSSQLTLEFDQEKRDRYGRLLAYAYSGSTLLQSELLEAGYATTLEVPPNTAKAEEFKRLEAAAREAGRGLWSAC